MTASAGVQKHQIKRVLGLALLLLTFAAVIGAIILAAELVVFSSTGADRAGVLNIASELSPDQVNRITWLPDAPSTAGGRALEPAVRRQVTDTYLRAWAQVDISYQVRRPYGLETFFGGPLLVQMNEMISATLSSPWQLRQSSLSHSLELFFYAQDGSVVGLRDHSARFVQQYRQEGGAPLITTSDSTYSVVMVLEQGNWRIRAWRREAALAESPAAGAGQAPRVSQPPGVSAGLVRAAGERLQVDGRAFYVAGANYYPAQTPWTLFWGAYDAAQTARDLRQAASLGLNSLRIFVPFADFGGDAVDPAMVARLEDFLDQAAAFDLKVIVTLFDHRTDHSIENWGADELHLAGVVGPIAGHPAVLAWDIKNEADRDDALNTPERNVAWLRHMAGQVRRLDPHHLLTVGWSTPQAALEAPHDFVDVVSFHYYGDAGAYGEALAGLRARVAGKPLLLSEYGQSTWNWLWPAGILEERQAEYIGSILAAQAEGGAAGELVWALFDFSTVPLTEFRSPWQKASQAHMGVLHTDGRPKPAAALLGEVGATLSIEATPGKGASVTLRAMTYTR